MTTATATIATIISTRIEFKNKIGFVCRFVEEKKKKKNSLLGIESTI